MCVSNEPQCIDVIRPDHFKKNFLPDPANFFYSFYKEADLLRSIKHRIIFLQNESEMRHAKT